MTQIFTAKTVDNAKALAARTFGADEENIQFEILEEPKKGLFGRLKGEAKIRATYIAVESEEFSPKVKNTVEIPEEEFIIDAEQEEVSTEVETIVEIPEEESVMDSELEEISPEVENIVEIPEEESVMDSELEEISPEVENIVEIPEEESIMDSELEGISPEVENIVEIPEKESVMNSEVEKISSKVENTVEIPTEQKQSAPVLSDAELITGEPSAQALRKIERAKTYLQGILKAMGVQAELKVNAGSESALIDIQAGSNGAVIGKHGDTLDALQYLTFMIANHGDKEYYRIILNSANYRERRKKTLEELAAKIAKNVLRTGHQTVLEPMNPYERRIIHSVIAEIDGIVSKSTGEEPYRKVIVSSENPPVKNNKRKNYHDRDNKRRNNNRRRNGKNHDNYYKKNQEITPSRISMDSMKTSFEKDYKRPRPEDELNAGLYGKIEF